MKRPGNSLVKKHAKRLFLLNNKSLCNKHFLSHTRPPRFSTLGGDALEIVALALDADLYSIKTYKLDIYGGLEKEWLAMRAEGSI